MIKRTISIEQLLILVVLIACIQLMCGMFFSNYREFCRVAFFATAPFSIVLGMHGFKVE